MISLAIFLAHGQIVFLVWVTFGERKWSILAERRGAWSTGAQIGLDYARSHFKCDEFPPAVCGVVVRKITMPDWRRIGGRSPIQCRCPELPRTDE